MQRNTIQTLCVFIMSDLMNSIKKKSSIYTNVPLHQYACFLSAYKSQHTNTLYYRNVY